MANRTSPLAEDNVLQEISRSFASTSAGPTLLDTLLLVGGIVLAVTALFFLKNTVQKMLRGPGEDSPQERRKTVLALLDRALSHRSRMDVSFSPIQYPRKTMSCALTKIEKQTLLLELPTTIHPAQDWISREVVCFFRLPGEAGRQLFYKFIAAITGLRHAEGIHSLVLALPERVELGQKRRHLRLEIPKTDVLDFRVWSLDENVEPPCGTDVASWPEPLAVYTPEDSSHLHIMDISGGGIKLEYDPRQYPTLHDFISTNPQLFMRLELRPTAAYTKNIYYMTAKLRTRQEDFGNGSFMLGYEFMECGRYASEDDIQWLKIDPDQGIDDLVTWIFKRHLELYREREIG